MPTSELGEQQAGQLARLTERLQLATGAAAIGIWDWDIVEDRLAWDETMVRLYGLRPEQQPRDHRSWMSIVAEADRARIASRVQEALRSEHPCSEEFEIQWPDGSHHVLRAVMRVVRDADGRATRMLGVNCDVTAQRRAEQSAAASEVLLRQLIKHTPAAVAMFDREMRYIAVSDRWLTDYHLQGQDVVGRSHYEVFPDIPERWKEVHRRVLAGAAERCDEDPFPRADGTTEWVHWDVRPWMTGEGDIGGLTMFTQVITERKRAEERLQDSETRFRTLSETALVGIYIVQDGRLSYVNRSLHRIFGYEDGELIGADPMVVIHPDDRGRVAENLGLRLGGSVTSMEYEFRGIRKDGETVFVNVLGSAVELDGRSAILGNIMDVSDRKRSERELRESARRFRELAENIDEVFWVTDPLKTQLLYVSPAFERVWNRPTAHLGSWEEAWLAAVHPDDRERVRQAGLTKRNRGEYDETYRIQRPDGSLRWIRDRAYPLRGIDGEVYRVVGTASDITEQQDLEVQMRQAQKMEAIGLLAGGVAHDFNNMLAVILSYSLLLAEGLNPLDPMHDDVMEIKTAANRAARLTEQLLVFSRRKTLQPRMVDLNEVLASTEKMLRRLIGEDVEMRAVPYASSAPVFVDGGQIEQVLMNLAVNARDAMPAGGTLTIEIGRADLGEAEAARVGLAPGAHATIAVTDTGIGMDVATRTRIFEPFFTTKAAGKGTGLGLSTVFGIVQQSGGHVAVQSDVGKGSAFRIYLPLASDDCVPESGTRLDEDLRGSETILLVEDEDVVRKVARTILTKKGYQVLEATSAGDALILCEQHRGRIHLLLTDMVMPRMSGDQLAARLSSARPGLRVAYMSGYPEKGGATQRGRTPDAFLPKPFTPQTLLRCVREALTTGPRT